MPRICGVSGTSRSRPIRSRPRARSVAFWFASNPMPLHRRIPKRGFHNLFRKEYRTVNVDRLNAFEAGSVLTPEALEQSGVLRKGADPIKILGNGELKVALTVRAHRFTASAAKKIEAAGGKAEAIEGAGA